MKLSDESIKAIVSQLNIMAETYYTAHGLTDKVRANSYCQGIAFALSQIGYAVEWDNRKAYVVEEE